MTDVKLLKFVTEFREGILDGRSSEWMCAAVCMPLVTLLSLYGIKAEMMESALEKCNHVWLRLQDGRVLDPTADQFGAHMPPVYLGPPTALHLDPEPYN